MGTILTTKTAQIMCINKSDRYNPHERIVNVGGYADKPWKITQERAIYLIENEGWGFYTSVKGKSVWVIVAESQYGNKYLKTEADKTGENNLLSLPECP